MVLFRKSFGKSLSQSWDQNRPEPIKNWIYNQSETQIMTSGAFQVLNTNVCVCVCIHWLTDSPVLVLVLVLVPVVVAFPPVTLRSVSCFTAACSRLNSQQRRRDVNKQQNQTNKLREPPTHWEWSEELWRNYFLSYWQNKSFSHSIMTK